MSIILFLMISGLLFLFLPVQLTLSGSHREGEETSARIGLGALAGLLGLRADYRGENLRLGPTIFGFLLFSFGSGNKKKKDAGEVEEEASEDGEDEEEDALDEDVEEVLSLWGRVEEFRNKIGELKSHSRRLKRPVWCFLKRLVSGFRFRWVSCDVLFGLSDPATTGQVYGYAMAFSNVLGPGARLNFSPDFVSSRVEGSLGLKVWIIPYRIVWAVVCLATRAGGAWVGHKLDLRKIRRMTVKARAAS